MKNFYPVALIDEIIPGKGLKVKLKKKTIAIFRLKDKIFAIQNKCPHQNADLSNGYIRNKKLYCYLHHWAFNLADGSYDFNPEMHLKIYETKVEDGMICIGLDE